MPIRSYYAVDLNDTIECSCGWRGRISAAMEVYDGRCEECNRMLLIVTYPTFEETKEAAAAGDPRALKDLRTALATERYRERFEALRLRSPAELPDLDGEAFAFAWDFEDDKADDALWTVIRLGEREVWREPALWEGHERFAEVKSILKERYGERFRSLTPTAASEHYLLGDRGRRVSTT